MRLFQANLTKVNLISVDRKEEKINRQIVLMNYNKQLILGDNE